MTAADTGFRHAEAVLPIHAARWCAMLNNTLADALHAPLGFLYAPQGFHWCLCLPESSTDELAVDGHPRRTDSDVEVLPRRMWASSKVEFLKPLTFGSSVERRSRILEVKEKSGSGGRLKFVDWEHLILVDECPSVRELQTIVYREATREPIRRAPPAAIAPDLSAWNWQRRIVPSETLLFRYSAMTFNAHRIHYDLPYATLTEGYPALVVQGPLIATLLLDLCRRELGDQRLATCSFRMLSAAFAGDVLYLVGRREEATISLAALGADGRTVMSATAVDATAV